MTSHKSPNDLQKQSNSDLRKLLTTILASVPDAMIVIDDKGIILAFSAAAETLFGYKEADLLGLNVSHLMTAADNAHHDKYIQSYLDTGEKQIIGIGRVVQARLASGEEIPVELKIGEARLDETRLFTGYIRDISEQRASQFRISQMQTELTNFSRLSAVGTMASAMAHELNQPLTAVTNYLEAARDILPSATPDTISIVQDALDAAAKEAIRAGQIVRKLRDYVSRGEVDRVQLDILPILQDAISLSKLGTAGRQVHFIKNYSPQLPLIMADQVQIRQVIINLIKNAIEAVSLTDTPQIWISAEPLNNREICISIRDNGPGLPKNLQQSPFDPFNSSKSSGMGLGLSICHTIIDAHDGRIWLDSTNPDGACFKFTLQIAQTNDEPAHNPPR